MASARRAPGKAGDGTTRYVALLRGVNVNGIVVKSDALRALFEQLGFGAVRTVLASGNVLFDAAGAAPALRATIEAALRECFGYDAWIVLIPQAQLAGIAARYPFERLDGERHPYVVFSSSREVLEELCVQAPAVASPHEQWACGDDVLYWAAPRAESTETPLAKLLAKPRYKRAITTRNLRTVEKLLAG